MRIPPRLLIVSLLAAFAYLPAAVGQQQGSVNIRERVGTSASGLPTVNVAVDRHRVPVGEEVTFTLSPADVVLNPNYIVTLDFGDGHATHERKTKFIHPYESAGNYRYSISVRFVGKPTPKVPQVFLLAKPTAVTTTQTVDFSAQLSDGYPNIKYRFVFADGLETDWQDSSYTRHEYASPRTFLAYVDIGAPDARGVVERIGGSERVAIQVIPHVVPQKPGVNLSAQPVKVEERQVVSFTAKVVSGQSNVRYRFVFGDKSAATDWQTNPEAKHRYLAGGTYSARVDVRSMNNIAGAQSASSSPVQIEVKPAAMPGVSLDANPTSVMENLPVFFRAKVDQPSASIRYRFNFGDGSAPTAWSARALETHVYSRAGSYEPLVEIGRFSNSSINAIASSRRQVTVTGFLSPGGATPRPSPSPGSATPTPDRSSPAAGPISSPTGGTASSSNGSSRRQTPDGLPTAPDYWWIYLLIALALFAGYRVWKWLTAPRPTFHPRLDPGVSAVGVEKPLSIDFQLQLNPNIAAGAYDVETSGSSFIKSERKSDD